MSKNNYQASLGDNNRKWVPSNIGNCFPDGERWALLELNPRAGYYQEIGRVVKFADGWHWGKDRDASLMRYETAQSAAKGLLEQLS